AAGAAGQPGAPPRRSRGLQRTARSWCVGMLALAAAPAAWADVFINELHYDDAGSDSGERVEVIAPAGTSLAGWSIRLYNGSGGAQYASFALSGTTSDQCSGYGTRVVDVPGIQNGGPDGLALVNASGVAVQFLSYEGSFTAAGGAAHGMASTPIGSAETSSTPDGHSLQLRGSGSSYEDFTWHAPAVASFGSCNSGQS